MKSKKRRANNGEQLKQRTRQSDSVSLAATADIFLQSKNGEKHLQKRRQ